MFGIDYLKRILDRQDIRHEDENQITVFYPDYQGDCIAFNMRTPYLRIVKIFGIDGVDKEELMKVINKANYEMLLTKAVIYDDNLWIIYDFLPNKYTEWQDIHEVLASINDMGREIGYDIGFELFPRRLGAKNGYEYLLEFLSNEGIPCYKVMDDIIAFTYKGIPLMCTSEESVVLRITTCIDENVFKQRRNGMRIVDYVNEYNFKRLALKLSLGDETVYAIYDFIPNDHTSRNEYMNVLNSLVQLAITQ